MGIIHKRRRAAQKKKNAPAPAPSPAPPAPTVQRIEKPLPPAPDTPIKSGVTVLILCAGELYPWEKSPRQFWPIGGEMVIERVLRQLRKHGYEPTIVTHRDDLKLDELECQYFEPQRRRTIAETWLYTRELWGEQTVILLGDVIFGKVTIEKWLAYRGTMRALGNSAEIFSFSFSKAEHQQVADTLYTVNKETGKGAPWLIYRKWCGMPYDRNAYNRSVFQKTWDQTADIDSMAEYEAAKKVWK